MFNKSKRNPRVANGHRRRQLRAQVLAEEDHCWLCGGWVDKELPAGHPMAAEVDEVLPVSLGGNPYDRANCRLAHRLHNQQRGNGLGHVRRSRVPSFVAGQDIKPGTRPSPPVGRAHPGRSAPDATPPSTGQADGSR